MITANFITVIYQTAQNAASWGDVGITSLASTLYVLWVVNFARAVPRADLPQLLVHARGGRALSADGNEHVRAAAVVLAVGLDTCSSVLA